MSIAVFGLPGTTIWDQIKSQFWFDIKCAYQRYQSRPINLLWDTSKVINETNLALNKFHPVVFIIHPYYFNNINHFLQVIASLVQLNEEGDPSWNCLHIHYSHVLRLLDMCRDDHMAKNRALPRDVQQKFLLSPTSKIFPSSEPSADLEDQDALPQCVVFVQEVTTLACKEFPNLWKLGQAYFKGQLVAFIFRLSHSVCYLDFIIAIFLIPIFSFDIYHSIRGRNYLAGWQVQNCNSMCIL